MHVTQLTIECQKRLRYVTPLLWNQLILLIFATQLGTVVCDLIYTATGQNAVKFTDELQFST